MDISEISRGDYVAVTILHYISVTEIFIFSLSFYHYIFVSFIHFIVLTNSLVIFLSFGFSTSTS